MQLSTFCLKFSALFLLLLSLAHLDVTAQNVLNQPPNLGSGILVSDSAIPQVVAEDFTTGSAVTVAQIIMYGVYFNANIVPTSEDFDIYILADAAGPGGVVGGPFTGVAPTSRTDTGNDIGALDQYQYVLDFTPVNLAAGTYYLEVIHNAPDGDWLGWTSGALDAVNGIAGAWVSFTNPGAAWTPQAPWDLAIQINDPPLPIELAEFRAFAEGSRIHVKWVTASETNNAGFDVEISSDRYHFERLGFVDGAGTTNEPKSYHFEFEARSPGTNYVRLRQVDFDGTFEYSPVVEVNTEVPGGLSLLPAYPNPITSGRSANLSFVVGSDMPVRLEVFDVLGRPVQTLFDGLAKSGVVQTVRFIGSDLPNGTYLTLLTTSAGSKIRTVTIAR